MFSLTPFKKDELARTGDVLDFYDSMFDKFLMDRQLPWRGLMNDTFKIDVKENDTEFVIDAEVAGVDKDDIHINYDHDNLLISVEKHEEKEETNEHYIHRERTLSSMQRGVYLPNVLEGAIKAHFENGVLKITAPKAKEAVTTKEIPIE